jgi:hypothetical protein
VLTLLPGVAPSGRVDVARLERTIRIASRLIPSATCLTQALALTDLLSRNGHDSTLRIGVANDGGRFAAHAWVECGGAPLLNTAIGVARYAGLLTWTPAQRDLFR